MSSLQNIQPKGVGLLLAGLLRRFGNLVVVILLDLGAGDLAAIDGRHHVLAALFAGAAEAEEQQQLRATRAVSSARLVPLFSFSSKLRPS